MKNKFYWYGNSAKMKIINEILNQISSKGLEKITIFDYGCGDCANWVDILSDFPQIELIGYDPCKRVIAMSREKLSGFKAKLFTGDELLKEQFKANYIVSFSVLEHVYDKVSYLKTIQKHLLKGGLVYLNYDDGHFRNSIDLSKPHLWLGQFKERVHNLLAPVMAKLGARARFQARVDRVYIDRMIQDFGFKVNQAFYSNVISMKKLCKSIPIDKRQAFSESWLTLEEELNRSFNYEENNPQLGDASNLWQELASRTLVLSG